MGEPTPKGPSPNMRLIELHCGKVIACVLVMIPLLVASFMADSIAAWLGVGPRGIKFALTGAALGVMVLEFWLIRCPACGERPLLHAIDTERFVNWLPAVTKVTECPRCGFHQPRATQNKKKGLPPLKDDNP